MSMVLFAAKEEYHTGSDRAYGGIKPVSTTTGTLQKPGDIK